MGVLPVRSRSSFLHFLRCSLLVFGGWAASLGLAPGVELSEEAAHQDTLAPLVTEEIATQGEESEIVPFSSTEIALEDLGLAEGELGIGSLGAGEAGALHFFFAVPEYDSRISLGVFDAGGRLVRVLAEDAPEEDFSIGLNGLMAEWDGRNDLDLEVPPGIYRVSGFAVGDFTDGEATYPQGPLPLGWGQAFGEGLPVRGILSLAVGPQNTLILLALTDAADGMSKEAVVLAYDPVNDRRLWSRKLPGENPGAWILGRPATDAVVVLGGEEVEVLDPVTGTALLRGRFPGGASEAAVASLEIADGEIRLSTPSGLQRFSLLDLQPVENSLSVPSGMLRLAQPPEGAMGLDEDGKLWLRERTWTIFLHEDEAHFDDFWPGREGRFWALVRQEKGGEVRVGQFNREGDFLRQVTPESFDGEPVALAVGPDEETLYVLVRGADAYQELLGLRKDIGSGRWMVFFRREAHPMDWLKEGDFRRLPLRMVLESPSTMGSGREASTLRLTLEDGTVRLSEASGLPLGSVVELPGATAASARVIAGASPVLVFRWLSDGRLLEREVRGWDRISRLQVGEFTWPPDHP